MMMMSLTPVSSSDKDIRGSTNKASSTIYTIKVEIFSKLTYFAELQVATIASEIPKSSLAVVDTGISSVSSTVGGAVVPLFGDWLDMKLLFDA